jgi:hypothetical protein
MGILFCDYPLRLGVADYELSVARYAQAAAAISLDISVFWFGKVKSPGLSDIDLLCVVPDDLPAATCRHLLALTTRDPLFVHGPVILPRSMLDLLPWVSPGGELRHVGGPGLNLGAAELPSDFSRYLHLANLVEGGLGRWMRLAQMRAEPLLPVRGSCLRLWGMNHALDSMRAAGLAVPAAASELVDSMLRMREEWAHQREIAPALLPELLERGLTMFDALILAGACEYRRLGGGGTAPLSKSGLLVNRSVIWPGSETSAIGYRRRTYGFAGKSRSYELLSLPRPVFAYYAARRDWFSDDAPIDVVLRQRSQAIGRHVAFLQSKGLPYERLDGQGRRAGHWLGLWIDRLTRRYLFWQAHRLLPDPASA